MSTERTAKPAPAGTVYTATARLYREANDFPFPLVARCLDTPNAIAKAAHLIFAARPDLDALWVSGLLGKERLTRAEVEAGWPHNLLNPVHGGSNDGADCGLLLAE